MSQNLNLSNYFFMIAFRLNIFGQNTTYICDVIHFTVYYIKSHVPSVCKFNNSMKMVLALFTVRVP